MDINQLCQPCFEAMRSFTPAEWAGLGVLGGAAAVSLFTKHNLLSMSKLPVQLVQGLIKSKTNPKKK